VFSYFTQGLEFINQKVYNRNIIMEVRGDNIRYDKVVM
jgi:hypothetical protein